LMQLALLASHPKFLPKTPDFGRSWTRNYSLNGVLDAAFRAVLRYAGSIAIPINRGATALDFDVYQALTVGIYFRRAARLPRLSQGRKEHCVLSASVV